MNDMPLELQQHLNEAIRKTAAQHAQMPGGGKPDETYCRYCKYRAKHKCKLHKCRIKNAKCNQLAVLMRQEK